MSGRSKGASKTPLVPLAAASSRPISDYFAPSSFSALSPDPPPTTSDPQPIPNDPPSASIDRTDDPPLTPVGGRRRKRKVPSPATLNFRPTTADEFHTLETQVFQIARTTLKCSCGQQYNSDGRQGNESIYGVRRLSLECTGKPPCAKLRLHDALRRHDSPYLERLDNAYRHLVSLGQPPRGHAEKRIHGEMTEPVAPAAPPAPPAPWEDGPPSTPLRRATPPSAPTPPTTSALAVTANPPVPTAPTSTGSERLRDLLLARPPYLQKAILQPKRGIFDAFLRILPSAHYSVPKSLDELLVDVRGTINPLLRDMQAIIADQDDLIKQLFSAIETPRPQLVDRSYIHKPSPSHHLDFNLTTSACPSHGHRVITTAPFSAAAAPSALAAGP
ncbi:hypothetical protein DFJ73DRAFT_787912 [Zopfochytrium polystomum]|nr:hypothetical protein DFJ73DRAFT_787912 [Zopfochytrium polystomum]